MKSKTLFKKILLKYYYTGWDHCSNNQQAKDIKNKLLKQAYNNGWFDFIAGDDITAIDLQTKSQILQNIKLSKT